MKLYQTPKVLADLEKGDIVYTIRNGQVMQARLVEYRTLYELTVNTGLRIIDSRGKSSFYKFETPTGDTFVVDGKYDCHEKVYLTLNDLRDSRPMKIQYGYLDTYGAGNAENLDARELFINSIVRKYRLERPERYCFPLYYIGAKSKQVCCLYFNELIDDGSGDISIGRCAEEYGFLPDMLQHGYYTTKEECQSHYNPDVLTF